MSSKVIYIMIELYIYYSTLGYLYYDWIVYLSLYNLNFEIKISGELLNWGPAILH